MFSQEKTRLCSAADESALYEYSLATGEPENSLKEAHTDYVKKVAYVPQGFAPEQRLIVSGSYDKTVKLWDLREQPTAGSAWSVGLGSEVEDFTFLGGENAQQLIAVAHRNSIALCDMRRSGEVVREFEYHQKSILRVVYD